VNVVIYKFANDVCELDIKTEEASDVANGKPGSQ